MQRKIYNSSNKIIGSVEISNDSISITRTRSVLNLVITDAEIVSWSIQGGYVAHIIKRLYDDFYLTTGEIAALGNVLYHRANKWVKECGAVGGNCEGRRNSSFRREFSEKRINAINAGRRAFFDNGGKIPQYVRTPEIREKISKGVKAAQKEGRLPDPREVARQAWVNGKFAKTNFKRGIGGFVYSAKNQKRIFFRSLFELAYIIMLEKDPSVTSYIYEPFHIKCDDGSSYTPDFLVNQDVIELKSKKFLSLQGEGYQKRFVYKCEQAQKFCALNGYKYKLVYDTDFGFDSRRFKHEIQDNNYINLYHISFFQPERVRLSK